MKDAVRVYTTAVPSGPHSSGAWSAVLTVQNRSGKVMAELSVPLMHSVHQGPTAHRDASIGAMLCGLTAARRFGARNVIVYSDSPPAVDVLNKRAQVSHASAGVYLQTKALAYSFRSAQYHYSPYPAMSDAPAIAAGC